MKVTKLKVSKFLGISLWQSSQFGKFNMLTGGNGAGKSTILKALKETFKSSGTDSRLIHTGESEAEIYVELDGRIEINRKITAGSNEVSVVDDGQPVTKAATYLKELLGDKVGKHALFFDPTAFYLADEREQREMLLKALPFTLDRKVLVDMLTEKGFENVSMGDVDFSQHGLEALGQIKKNVYDRRHEQNIKVIQLKKAIDQSKAEIPDTFDKKRYQGFDLQKAVDEVTAADRIIQEHERDKQSLEQLRQARDELKADIEQTRARLAMLEEKLQKIQEQGHTMKDKVESFKAPNVELTRAAINEYKNSQKLIHKIDEIEERRALLDAEVAAHKKLDNLYVYLNDQVTQKVLESIDLPIKGLSIDAGGEILIDGKSIKKLSTSEQMRLAVKVARLLIGDLKVICIDNIEMLDAEAFAAFEAETKDDGIEYFACRVTAGPLEMVIDGNGNGSKPAEKAAAKPSKVRRKSVLKG